MTNDKTYNGWTNKQTWNISMTYDEIFRSMCEDQNKCGAQMFGDVDDLAEAFEMMVDSLEFQGLKQGSLAYDALGEYLCRVNWKELAEHLAADYELFQEEETCSAE